MSCLICNCNDTLINNVCEKCIIFLENTYNKCSYNIQNYCVANNLIYFVDQDAETLYLQNKLNDKKLYAYQNNLSMVDIKIDPCCEIINKIAQDNNINKYVLCKSIIDYTNNLLRLDFANQNNN